MADVFIGRGSSGCCRKKPIKINLGIGNPPSQKSTPLSESRYPLWRILPETASPAQGHSISRGRLARKIRRYHTFEQQSAADRTNLQARIGQSADHEMTEWK